MASYMITDKYAFGGVKVSSKESIDIRINQINDKFRLHTCYYYGDSLKIISKASKEINLIPKLIVKLYFNYNFFWIDSLPDNRRFNSCYDQLKIIIDELNFIPDDLHLEICCNPPLKNIKNNEFQKFKEKVQKEFNVNKFYLETFPDWEFNTKKIIESNFLDGSLFHYNILEKSFFDEIFLKKEFIIVSPLGGGGDFGKVKGRIKNIENEKKYIDFINFCKDTTGFKSTIDLYISFANTLISNPNFQYFITRTGSIKHYNDLKNILFNSKDLIIKDEHLKNILLYKKKYLGKTHRDNVYGLYPFFSSIIKNKRWRVKQILLSKLFSRYEKTFL